MSSLRLSSLGNLVLAGIVLIVFDNEHLAMTFMIMSCIYHVGIKIIEEIKKK